MRCAVWQRISGSLAYHSEIACQLHNESAEVVYSHAILRVSEITLFMQHKYYDEIVFQTHVLNYAETNVL